MMGRPDGPSAVLGLARWRRGRGRQAAGVRGLDRPRRKAICYMHMAYSPVSPVAALRRAQHRQWTLKPQDLAVALKLVALRPHRGPRPSYLELAKALHLSPYEAHAAVQRLLAAGLAAPLEDRILPVSSALANFVLQGAIYCFPPVRGELTIGVPTARLDLVDAAHAVRPTESGYVWPHPQGSARGESLLALYPALPLAARADAPFYALLSAFDLLRVGQARERKQARMRLESALA